jgi:hypothetical protein
MSGALSRSFATSRFRLRTPLALCLCLLAFLFAIEAKTAWYVPAAGFGSSVRAAKAQPVATPKVVEHGVPVSDPARPDAAFALIPPTAVALSARFPVQTFGKILLTHLPYDLAPGFSYSGLFRPPPAY